MTSPAVDAWATCPVPPTRRETLFGDREVTCFHPRPNDWPAMFNAAAARAPAAEALVCDGQRLNYAELQAESRRGAAALAALGVARGDRVVMFVSNRIEFVPLLLALAYLGAIAVPVGVREQRPGLAYITRQCGAVAIVADADLAGRLPEPSDAPALRHRIALGTAPAGLSWAALLAAAPPTVPAAALAETDVAVILYTSGTTGAPKGAMLTQLNIVHSVLHFQAGMQLGPHERSALAVPASHVTGLVAIVITMLALGGCVVVVPTFKAETFIALMARERVSHTLMVPAMYQLCLMHEHFATTNLSAWRVGGYGGAPMPVATIDALAAGLPGLTLQNAYGATETTSPTTLMPAGLTRAHADSVGQVLPAAEVKVVDEHGHELPAGQSGELWIAGPMVVPGYWANHEATAAAFTQGWWHSGDMGSVDEQGFVRVFDRKKDMLNRGGYKVYSVEVENALMAWPGVLEAAVVGRPCPVLGERVHAFVHAPGVAPNDNALRSHCAAQLADYKVPETITWADQPLPRNANGKLIKRVLRERLPP